MLIVWTFIFLMIMAISVWDMFTKAGEKGWKAFIPIYNGYILTQMAGKPGWLIFLVYLPYVFLHLDASEYSVAIAVSSVVAALVYLIISIDLAKAFGKSTFFGVVGIFFFSFFGFMILGWGDAKYHKPKKY